MTSRHRKNDEGLEARPSIVGLHYRVIKKIGEGSFGEIFEGVSVMNNQPVAIKFESRKNSNVPAQLREEYRNYKILAPSVGIPSVYYFGQDALYNCLVMDLLGPSLEDLFNYCSRRFSIKTCCMLAKQMISRVQTIHEKNLIYRDIKPDNFLIGRHGKSNVIYVVDFGMAKYYRDPKTKVHIPDRDKKSLSGTARYMSINTHLGREQSRRDDMEALGHVFLYFLRGSLPWQGLKAASNKEKYEKIGQKKQSTPIKELCDGFPEEVSSYMHYVRTLKFEEAPDYDYLRGLFTKILQKINAQDDGVYDWVVLEKIKKRDGENGSHSKDNLTLGKQRGREQLKQNTGASKFVNESNQNILEAIPAQNPEHINSPVPVIPDEKAPKKKRSWFSKLFCFCFRAKPASDETSSQKKANRNTASRQPPQSSNTGPPASANNNLEINNGELIRNDLTNVNNVNDLNTNNNNSNRLKNKGGGHRA